MRSVLFDRIWDVLLILKLPCTSFVDLKVPLLSPGHVHVRPCLGIIPIFLDVKVPFRYLRPKRSCYVHVRPRQGHISGFWDLKVPFMKTNSTWARDYFRLMRPKCSFSLLWSCTTTLGIISGFWDLIVLQVFET